MVLCGVRLYQLVCKWHGSKILAVHDICRLAGGRQAAGLTYGILEALSRHEHV